MKKNRWYFKKNLFVFYLFLDFVSIRLWRRKIITRNFMFLFILLKFCAFKILQDAPVNVCLQTMFQFGLIGIIFLSLSIIQ